MTEQTLPAEGAGPNAAIDRAPDRAGAPSYVPRGGRAMTPPRRLIKVRLTRAERQRLTRYATVFACDGNVSHYLRMRSFEPMGYVTKTCLLRLRRWTVDYQDGTRPFNDLIALLEGWLEVARMPELTPQPRTVEFDLLVAPLGYERLKATAIALGYAGKVSTGEVARYVRTRGLLPFGAFDEAALDEVRMRFEAARGQATRDGGVAFHLLRIVDDVLKRYGALTPDQLEDDLRDGTSG